MCVNLALTLDTNWWNFYFEFFGNFHIEFFDNFHNLQPLFNVRVQFEKMPYGINEHLLFCNAFANYCTKHFINVLLLVHWHGNPLHNAVQWMDQWSTAKPLTQGQWFYMAVNPIFIRNAHMLKRADFFHEEFWCDVTLRQEICKCVWWWCLAQNCHL